MAGELDSPTGEKLLVPQLWLANNTLQEVIVEKEGVGFSADRDSRARGEVGAIEKESRRNVAVAAAAAEVATAQRGMWTRTGWPTNYPTLRALRRRRRRRTADGPQ